MLQWFSFLMRSYSYTVTVNASKSPSSNAETTAYIAVSRKRSEIRATNLEKLALALLLKRRVSLLVRSNGRLCAHHVLAQG